jgi:hypothetical protein
LRHARLLIAAGIEERHDADRRGDLDPGLEVEGEAGIAADREIRVRA